MPQSNLFDKDLRVTLGSKNDDYCHYMMLNASEKLKPYVILAACKAARDTDHLAEILNTCMSVSAFPDTASDQVYQSVNMRLRHHEIESGKGDILASAIYASAQEPDDDWKEGAARSIRLHRFFSGR
jgi:hypothetical protein